MKLILTRHGETEENKMSIIQGNEHGNISERGEKQIEDLIKKIKNLNLDLIISSDSVRCKKTTSKIIKKLNLPVIFSEIIREKDNGELVGKNSKEINWDIFGNDFDNRKPKNGESLNEVKERSIKFLNWLLNNYKDKNILIISHACFLKILMGNLLGMSLYNSIFRLNIEHCSLSEIDIENENNYKIKYINH